MCNIYLGGKDATLHYHDRLCRSAYRSGKHEARFDRLYPQTACGG